MTGSITDDDGTEPDPADPQPEGPFWYAEYSDRYHTEARCPSVSAYDSCLKRVETADELPDDLAGVCGNCRRVGVWS
jgi:hypothetical protein